MAACDARAVLVVTRAVVGTSTSVARERIDLECGLVLGHPGKHRDGRHAQEWESRSSQRPTLLRHEDEDEDS